MDEYRGILALLSGTAGAILLVYAIRVWSTQPQVPHRRRRLLISLLYAGLFSAAGIVLWQRKDVSHAIPESAQPRTEAATPAEPEAERVKVTSPPRPEIVRDTLTQTKPENTAQESDVPWREDFQRLVAPRETQSTQLEPEDPLYTAIERAFTAIEEFFYRYGSPAPEEPLRRASFHQAESPAPQIQFPHITFEEGSSKISNKSLPALMSLAADLKQYPDISVEIQTRVDSLGSEAYNYMLTQARASAVKDLLVVEGVPAERLVAKGLGTRPLSAGADAAIAFVVRR